MTKQRTLYIMYLLTTTIICFAIIEYISMKINQKNNVSLPYLINTKSTKGLTTLEQTTLYNALDPVLGYSQSPSKQPHFSLPGFFVHSNRKMKQDDYVIVALGGSTTDPLIYHQISWPEQLAKILQAHSLDAIVINGGVGGYSSNQELIKLIRDVLELEPDVVISHNGVNDRETWAPLPNPMVHSYQRKTTDYIINNQTGKNFRFLPNTLYLLHGLNQSENIVSNVCLGIDTKKSHGQYLVRNIDIMHNIASGFGIKYIAFLQPLLGIGTYKEAGIKALVPNNSETELRKIYNIALQAIKTRNYYVDLTDVFIGNQNVYKKDGCHLTSKGNRIVAQAMFDELRKQDLLPASN